MANQLYEVRLLQPQGPSHRIEETSFEAAALAYVEDWLPPDELHEVSVSVRATDTGAQHCFRIDLDHGALATPCD